MTNVGYATLSIIPSMQGFSSLVEREMAPQLARVGRTAGVSAGREVGKGISAGVKENGPSSSGVFGNIEKGATVAGVGAGRRFGTALHETLGEYTKTIGATMVGFFAYEKVKEFASSIIEEGQAAAKTGRLTEAVIKSTGGAANVTAQHVDELAASLSKVAGLDDDTVKAGENMLLTFKNVRNEVGKGNNVFDQATTSIVDMASAMAASHGGEVDLKSSAILVGKALNDPVKGLAALQRVGVSFDATTRDNIKSLVEQGRTMDAQKIILGELKSEFGGAGAALSDPVKRAGAEWKNFEEELGLKVLPVVNSVASAFTDQALPALKESGDYAGQVAKGWSNLPTPIKDAAIAAIAFKAASKFGYIDTLTQSMSALRLNTQLVGVAYDEARVSSGRFSSGLSALRTGVSLTNAATRRSIAGIAGMGLALSGLDSSSNKTTKSLSQIGTGALLGFSVGGPWGAAIGGAIGLLGNLANAGGKVAESQDKIRSAVSEVTDTLNQQTGAITANTVEAAKKALADAGVYDAAQRMGIGLGVLTKAYLGNKGAMVEVGREMQVNYNRRMAEGGSAVNGLSGDMSILNGAILTQGDAIDKGRRHILEMRDATNGMKGATQTAASATDAAGGHYQTYADKIDRARIALQKLEDKENRQRTKALQVAQDRLALTNQGRTSAQQAKKGAGKGLDGSVSQAASDNRQALLDLASQFENSAPRIRNSAKVYETVRAEFIKDAIQMGDTKTQAKKLADAWLQMPKSVVTKYGTKGDAEALARIKRLKAAADELAKSKITLAINVAAHQAGNRMLAGARALGGPVVKGSSYLVGEKGPEIFTPDSSGGITPNDKIGGARLHVGEQHFHGVDYYQWKRDQEHEMRVGAMGGVNFV